MLYFGILLGRASEKLAQFEACKICLIGTRLDVPDWDLLGITQLGTQQELLDRDHFGFCVSS